MPALSRRLAWAAVGLVGVVAGLALRSGAEARRASIPPAVVATVNIDNLFDKSDEWKSRKQKLEAENEVRYKELTAMKDEVEGLEKKLKEMPKDQYDQRRDLFFKLQEKAATLKMKDTSYAEQLEYDKGEIIRDVYNHVTNVVGRYAQGEGIDLVLFDDSTVELPSAGGPSERIKDIIRNKQIIHTNAAKLDITDQVAQILNNEFRAGVKPAAAPAPEGGTKPAKKK